MGQQVSEDHITARLVSLLNQKQIMSESYNSNNKLNYYYALAYDSVRYGNEYLTHLILDSGLLTNIDKHDQEMPCTYLLKVANHIFKNNNSTIIEKLAKNGAKAYSSSRNPDIALATINALGSPYVKEPTISDDQASSVCHPPFVYYGFTHKRRNTYSATRKRKFRTEDTKHISKFI